VLQRGDGLCEHPLVRGRAGHFEIGARTRKRELDGAALRQRVAFFWRQPGTERLRALRFSLLKLDVLALKPSRHRDYSILTGCTARTIRSRAGRRSV